MSMGKLPIELKSNQLAVKKRNNKRTIEGIIRVGKILLKLGIGYAGVFIAVGASHIVTVIGLGVGIATWGSAAVDATFKKISKNSMFAQIKGINGETKIVQRVIAFKSFQKMKGFQKSEKSGMMGLEILTALQSIKKQYEDIGIETNPTRDGKNNVYPSIFCVTTHEMNIKTVEALEKLGYLQIERKEPKGTSNLFYEKLQFADDNKERRAILYRALKNELPKVPIYDLAVRVTDKQLDLEYLYKEYLKLKGTREKSERTSSIKRLGIIMEALRKRNIDIVKNDIGETIIDYNSKESFATRMKREQTDTCATYRKSSYIGDTIDQHLVQTQEQRQGRNQDDNVVKY